MKNVRPAAVHQDTVPVQPAVGAARLLVQDLFRNCTNSYLKSP